MSCARLALRAATGMAGGRVDAAIAQAFANLRVPVDWNRINTKVWRAALELFGFVVVRDDVPEPQSNVDQFMAANDHKDVVLVVVHDARRPDDDHVFAAQGRCVVDFYTEGRSENYDGAKNELRQSRVLHIVHVRRRL
jgi:hypothetical protein